MEHFTQAEIESGGQKLIRTRCIELLSRSHILVAPLDGAQVDDGTAFEIGWFYARKPENPIAGIRSDVRYCGEVPGTKLNAMLEDSVKEVSGHLFADTDDLVRTLSEIVRLVP